jgi:hypothetical protein
MGQKNKKAKALQLIWRAEGLCKGHPDFLRSTVTAEARSCAPIWDKCLEIDE